MSKLTNYVDTLIELARQQGLNETDIVYRLAPDVILILSDNEPTTHLFPLNGVWVMTDASAPTYKTVYKRVSKTPSAGFSYTWNILSEYDDMMAVQQWDAQDLPAPSIISGKGGQMEMPLLPRIINTFLANEMIPRSYADSVRTSLSNGFSVMLNNLNSRTTANTGRITEMNQTIRFLENKVDDAINSGSVRGLVLIQENETPLWAFNHEFGAGRGFCFCTDLNGEIIWPERVYSDPESPDTLFAEFLEPFAGFGIMLFVPISNP